jgi:hypothetical protein
MYHPEFCELEGTTVDQYLAHKTVIAYIPTTGVPVLINENGLPVNLMEAVSEVGYDCRVEHNQTSCGLWNAWGGPEIASGVQGKWAHMGLMTCAVVAGATGVGAPVAGACLGADAYLNWKEGDALGMGMDALAVLGLGYGRYMSGRPTSAGSALDIEGANWAQTTARFKFSDKGRFALTSIDDVSNNLRTGVAAIDDVPVHMIVRDGKTLILDSRSSVALTQAGIARSAWNVHDVTGVQAFETRLSAQLANNGLGSSGTNVIIVTGR